MTAQHLDAFNFDPKAHHDLEPSDDFEIDIVPIVDLEEIQVHSIEELVNSIEEEKEEQEENTEDDEKIHDHYMKLLASDFRRAKRAKQDRDDRASIRKHFEVLSELSHRVQMEHSIDVSDKDDLCRPSDSFRCRDSNLRTLRKATKTLQELLALNRELKQERLKVKEKLRAHKATATRPKKRRSPAKPTVSNITFYDNHRPVFNNVYPNSHYSPPQPCQSYSSTPIPRVVSAPYLDVKPYPSHMYASPPAKIYPHTTYSAHTTPAGPSYHHPAHDVSKGTTSQQNIAKPCRVVSM